MSTLPPLRLLDDMIRINKDGSISVGILAEEITPKDVKVEAEQQETFTSPDVKKPVRKPAAKKTVKK